MRANFNSGSEQRKTEEAAAKGLRGFFQRAPRTSKWIERVLLVSGLALVVIYGAARIESLIRFKTAMNALAVASSVMKTAQPISVTERAAPSTDETTLPSLDLPNVDFRPWSAARIRKYLESATAADTPLAVLGIPKIDLEVPVFEGTDVLTLNHGAGRIAGTARPGEQGNIGIAAHRDSFFRRLKELQSGDEILLTTTGGRETYVVDQIQIVQPSDVSVLRARPQPSLTLVTCYPFYYFGDAPQRFIVSASRSEEINRSAVDVGPSYTNSTRKGESQ